MDTLKRWIARHPGWSYLGLAIVITWTLLLPAALGANGLIGWSPPAIWHALGALGPVLAAYLVIAALEGRAGLRRWLGQQANWRIDRGWLAIAALSPLALLAIAIVMGRIIDGSWPDFSPALRAPYGAGWMLVTLLIALAYGFGEEPGWRGFLLPLLSRHGPVATTLLLTLAWGVWHGLMFTYRLPNEPLMIVGFFMGLLAGAIWLNWLYTQTRSILAVAIWHAVWDIVNVPSLLVSKTVIAALSTEVMVLALAIVAGWLWNTYRPGQRGASQGRGRPV